MLVKIGTTIGLLPKDQTLTVTDRKKNAVFSVLGVLLIGMSMILDPILKKVV